MKNDFANWKPKRSENWFRNFRSGTFRSSSAAAETSFVCTYGTCNRFLNANKCHQSIFIIMAAWLIALDFSQTNEPLNERHWRQFLRQPPVMNGGGRIRCKLECSWLTSIELALETRNCSWNVFIVAQFVVHCSQMQRQHCNKFPIIANS